MTKKELETIFKIERSNCLKGEKSIYYRDENNNLLEAEIETCWEGIDIHLPCGTDITLSKSEIRRAIRILSCAIKGIG